MALFPLGVKVELLINGTWRDISDFVYQRDTIQITGGRTAKGDTQQPAQAVLTVNNRDGRFSPLYTAGAYYPYLKRNVKLRISVSDTSSSGNVYAGYRFWGEVSTWPPLSDISGHDVYAQVTASGPLRRIRSGGGKGSALTRYYSTLTGSYAPIAYWPCEEDPDTSIVGAGIDGGTNMTVTVGTPKWKAISDFNGSGPVGVLNSSTWDGLTGSFNTGGNDVYAVPGTYTFVASTTTVDARCWGGGAGGANGAHGAAGGGGEFARDSAVATTVGSPYTVVVGDGGSGGAYAIDGTANAGANGNSSTFAGNSVTVTAHGGTGNSGFTGGAGGTGSTNATHFNGGAAGSNASNFAPGAGGGSSAGTAAVGGAGGNVTGGSSPGAGGTPPAGAGGGGTGGDNSPFDAAHDGVAPGGGGGGGADTGTNRTGGSGAAGQVQLVYTPQTVPTNNVVRFIMFVPVHGGNNGKVLVRAITGGTIAQLDVVYVSVGKLQLKGYSNVAALLFTSSTLTVGNGQTLMVSAELATSGADVAYKLQAIIPGEASVIGTVSGTQTTATVGNVTEVFAGPDANITKTAIGHISVQYALIPLTRVSKALHGHHTEMGIDRFIRLANEQAMDNAVEYSETADHWGFETGTQSWVGTNCALTSSTVTVAAPLGDSMFTSWPPDGTHSLLMTANGGGQPTATSPTGTSGQPVNVGDTVSVNAEFYAVATHSNVFVGILWYTAAGAACAHAGDDSADTVVAASTLATLKVKATAPATAAFFAVKVGNHNVDANNTLLYCDNVRTHPRMGPQTRKEYHKFLEEIEDLDQGIMKEARELWGMKYRTRIRLVNQAAAVTLDYSAGTVSPPLAPVVDDKNTKNDITVHRHKGSKIRVTSTSGGMSVLEPPAGTGRHKKHLRVAAEEDQQLAALASHLLLLGTASDERYPVITVNLARAGITSNAVAPLMSAIASVEIGDRVKVTNLPFWYPSATADQMVIGYTETLGPYDWQVMWNCTPFSPYVQVTSTLRRW